MASSMYMDNNFVASDHYGSVPVPVATSDPSCDSEAHICHTKRIPNPHASSYDPHCEVVTTCGITNVDGHDIGWIRVDHEGSAFDPNATSTRAIELEGGSTEVSVYRHIWPRMWNDPLASSSFHIENSLDQATKLRSKIAKIISMHPPK